MNQQPKSHKPKPNPRLHKRKQILKMLAKKHKHKKLKNPGNKVNLEIKTLIFKKKEPKHKIKVQLNMTKKDKKNIKEFQVNHIH